MPFLAPIPLPTIMATGVARPRAQGQLIIGAVLYSNAMGELGRTTQAERLLENLIKERKTQL